jgi:hypothetical protein
VANGSAELSCIMPISCRVGGCGCGFSTAGIARSASDAAVDCGGSGDTAGSTNSVRTCAAGCNAMNERCITNLLLTSRFGKN